MEVIDQYKCVDLFPYDIQDVNAFYHRNHPEYFPRTKEWNHYWAEQWKYIIEGRWIKDKDTWVYMMPKLYYYINFGTIELQGRAAGHRPLGPPKLRDNEWIIFTYLFCCQGFSGFEGDRTHTCNTVVRDILDEDSDVTIETASYLTDECFIDNDRRNGLKTYVDAWYYLTQHYLIDSKPEKPLGLPLYQNEVSNAMIFSARTLGKTFTVACGDLNHEWITGGIKYTSDLVNEEGKNQLDKVKIEMFVGASTSKYLTNFMSKARTSYENMPGKFTKFGRSEQSPFFRVYSGNWLNTNTPTIQEYITADGGRGGSESKITKAVVSTGTEEIAVGQRPVRIYVDEVGLLEHAKRFHFANDNALKVDRKHGMAVYTGTSGNLEKIQDVKEMFLNPLRYDIFSIPNYWEGENKRIGLFIPYYYAKTEWKDENGNTDPAKGISAILKIRKAKGIDGSDGAINILSEPLKPSEMFIAEGENLFPQDRIIKRIEELEAGLWQKKAQTGQLEYLSDKKTVRFLPVDDKPITTYEIKKNQEKGVCVFYEHPRDDTPDARYEGALYKIVYDPVSEEKGGTSLASVIVYKSLPKPYRAGEMYNTIVAEWIGRRHSLEEMHEIAIKFALYYKAKILFEANVSGVAVYFRTTNRTHLLQPALWAAQETILKGKPKRNYTYGQKMTKENKESCIKDLNQWAREVYSVGEEGETFTNIDRLYSLRLLYEMNFYNTYDNFDHLSAFLLMMMWLRQESRVEVMIEESKQNEKEYKELYDFVHTKHYSHEFNPLLEY